MDTDCSETTAEEYETDHEEQDDRTMNPKNFKNQLTLPSVKYSEEDLREAVQLIKNGSLSKTDASKIYNIPRQTLQFRLDRSKNQGRYQKQGERALNMGILKKKLTPMSVKYSEEDMQEAIELIQNGILSKMDASKIYDIPRKTIQDRLDRLKNQSRGQKPVDEALNKKILKKKLTPASLNYVEEDLHKAIELIQNGTLTKTDASKIYDIPRQTLQCRLDRLPNPERNQKQVKRVLNKEILKKKLTPIKYSQKAMQEALELIKNGTLTTTDASRLYKIPRQTLQDRLKKQGGDQKQRVGALSKKLSKKKPVTVKYSEEVLQEALKRIQNGTLTRNGASKIYKIPRQTLQYRLGKRFKKVGKGPATVLHKEEEDFLVKWLDDSSRRGRPKTRLDLIKSVEEFLKINPDRKTPFTSGRPGISWLNGFLRRHPQVSFKIRKRSSPDEAANLERKKIREALNEIKIKNTVSNLKQEQTTPSLVYDPIIVHLKSS